MFHHCLRNVSSSGNGARYICPNSFCSKVRSLGVFLFVPLKLLKNALCKQFWVLRSVTVVIICSIIEISGKIWVNKYITVKKIIGSWPNVVTFEADLKSNMAALATDWLTHFELLLKNDCRDLHVLQICHKCSLWGPDQVLLLFKLIQNPIWPHWPLIVWHILNFFSRTAAWIYSKFTTNIPYEVLTKYCYFLSWSEIQYGHPGLWLADTFSNSRMTEGIYSKLATNVPYEILTKCFYYLSGSESNVTTLASEWLTYKKLMISFCFKFLSGIYKEHFLS